MKAMTYLNSTIRGVARFAARGFAYLWVASIPIAAIASPPAATESPPPAAAELPPAARETPPPNIVFVLADDLGPGDVGCYGGTLAATPSLDRIAREGTRFTQFYAASPICSPSRVGFTTGMFPARWNITSYLQTRAGNRNCQQADFLDPAAPSLARILKNAGYATAHFGKWHMGGGRDVVDAPKFAAYGFDAHAGTYESPQPHPDITATNWIWSPQDKVKRWDRSRFFVDKALDFLKQNRARPSFVQVWLDDVHTPWVPGEQAAKGDTRANLKPVIEECDRQIGRLLDGIAALGIDDNTLVIFASDNGPFPTFRDDGNDRTGGLRGSKWSLYEGGIRMPLIVRWPARVPKGRVDEQSVLAAVDFLPTLCAIANAKPPADVQFDGQDVRQALFGKKIERDRPLYWEYGRNEKHFLYPRNQRDRSPNVAIRDGKWKLLINADGSDGQLYDLTNDPSESRDLASEQPGLATRLTESALAWRTSLPRLDISETEDGESLRRPMPGK